MLLKTGEVVRLSSPNTGGLILSVLEFKPPKGLNNPPTKFGELEYILGLSINRADGW